jgi:hypothetical protein
MMEVILNPENRILWSVISAALALILIATVFGLRWRANNSVDGRLRKAANELLQNILVPDGEDNEIHVEYALLTPRGVVLIEVRDVIGKIFGSEAMEDWTVLSDRQRFTFSNPLHRLYDRLAAVKRLLPDVPVDGFVAFTNRGEFTKGQPGQVVMLDKFIDDLHDEKKSTPVESVEGFYPQWNRLREESVSIRVGQLLRK